MEISLNETKAIAETLPIGLYAKRRIPTAMSETEETSYYNPMSDEIVISYPIIAEGLKNALEDNSYKETAVRSMLYHELSHAVLTPQNMLMPKWMNVFEDERIETLLSNYYLDVDFKKQVLLINGYRSVSEIGTPTSAFQDYYNIVRFGIGKKEFVDEVTEIINKYSHLTRTKNYYWDYYYAVEDLYNRICSDFGSADEDGADGSDSKSGGKSGSSKGSVIMDGIGSNGENSNGNADGESKNNGEASEDGNASTCNSAEDGDPSHGSIAVRVSPLTSEEIEKMFEETFNKNPYVDTALTQKMGMIIDNFSKRNNSGSSMSAYSGVFNPRSVARRDDYKYWDKQSTINGANKFGSLHLNLFIDESGSFYWSEEPMNKLLKALTEIEAKNKNFTLDVVFCGMGERVVKNKRGRIFHASGGNRLDKKVYDIYRKLQKPNTFNYNIACFDGDACSDGGRNDHGFGAFDHNNCTIISDRDNERYIKNDVHSAKVIYTNNYASELIDNVVAILSKAFR